MILDTLHNHKLYINLHPLFDRAFDYLVKTNLSELSPGRHDIQGDDLFVIYQEYETKDISICRMESHKKYIDIQYMVSGEEMMGVSLLNNQPVTQPYEESKEVAFYTNNYDSMVKVSEGQFTIFFPNDLHMPCLKVGASAQVRKAVIKIKLESLL